MKTTILKTLIIIILLTNAYTVNSQIFYAGRSSVLIGSCLNNSLNNYKTFSFRYGYELSGSYEYAISDFAGFGFTGEYARHRDWSYNNYYDYYGADRIAVLMNLNFHKADTYVIDPYFKMGLGAAITFRDYYYNYYIDDFSDTNINLAYEVSGGAKLMLTEYIGIYSEVGLRNVPGTTFNFNLNAGLAFAF